MRRWFILGLAHAAGAALKAIPRLGQLLWTALDLALMVFGLALIVVGVAQWSAPAAYVLAGLALLALGVLPIRRRS
jgi:Na+-translocating ferredoxin:NAD+ oxidoreductase RnfD subunit